MLKYVEFSLLRREPFRCSGEIIKLNKETLEDICAETYDSIKKLFELSPIQKEETFDDESKKSKYWKYFLYGHHNNELPGYYMGIDVLLTNEGYKVCEVNMNNINGGYWRNIEKKYYGKEIDSKIPFHEFFEIDKYDDIYLINDYEFYATIFEGMPNIIFIHQDSITFRDKKCYFKDNQIINLINPDMAMNHDQVFVDKLLNVYDNHNVKLLINPSTEFFNSKLSQKYIKNKYMIETNILKESEKLDKVLNKDDYVFKEIVSGGSVGVYIGKLISNYSLHKILYSRNDIVFQRYYNSEANGMKTCIRLESLNSKYIHSFGRSKVAEPVGLKKGYYSSIELI